jgi:GT2 family glycosyltransferase
VLIFCDADDVAASGWLLALARMAAIHPVVAGSIEVNHLNQALPWRPNPFTSSNQPVLGFLPYAPGANIAIAREAFDSVGGFSEDTPPCEDVDIAWRLQLKGYTIHDAPEAVMHIRYRETMHTLWKQIAMYGECHAFLYKRFAPYGMPRSSLRAAWRKCLWLLALAPRLPYADLKERSAWLYAAAARWGRLRGSLRYHTLYL